MNKTIAWIGLDCHTRNSVFTAIDGEGKVFFSKKVPTTKEHLIKVLQDIKADKKCLALEECAIARWISGLLAPHVSQLIVSDPTKNALIGRGSNKRDLKDSENLARLYRLNELKPVWQPPSMQLAAFRDAANAYSSAVNTHTKLQRQIKGQYHRWGLFPQGSAVFGRDREEWLWKLPEVTIRSRVAGLYELFTLASRQTKESLKLMILAGSFLPDIVSLQTMPGIGKVGAHAFAGLILDPERFKHDSAFIRYCKLGIKDRSSDDKPLGYQKLDPAGHGVLKAVSYRAWLYSMRAKVGPVYQFYQASLKKTGCHKHARLNTQRKILLTLWRMWRRKESFNPEKFLKSIHQPT